jgi:hypothetical protein
MWDGKRRKEALAQLAPIVSGAVSSKEGHLEGIYGGHEVEAWTWKRDPTPSGLSSDAGPEFQVFNLRITDVQGRAPWACVRAAQLNPLASPEYEFDLSYAGLGPLSGLIGAFAHEPPQDPELEDRLRAAGVVEVVEALGSGKSGFLPRIRYTPALEPKFAALQARFPPELRERIGELYCEVEVRRDTDPTPERFSELLELAFGLVAINAAVNPAA